MSTPWRRSSPAAARCAPMLALILLASAADAQTERFGAPPADLSDRLDRLVAAYPDHLVRHDGENLIWRDGAATPISDGRTDKTFQQLLDTADIDDMFAFDYPSGAIEPPAWPSDPGRIRDAAFFLRLYGDCRKGDVEPRLRTVTWLPSVAPQRLRVTTVNGVADRLEAVSAELERLPSRFHRYLTPSAGTYNCRVIAGADRLSMHASGAAIDLNVEHADFWRWAGEARPEWRNRMPAEIVAIFERHGFIWGGRWRHYDTMHFEYRPELAP